MIPTPATGKNRRQLVYFGSRPAFIKSKEARTTEKQVRARILYAVQGCALPLFDDDDDVAVTVRHHVQRQLCEVIVERIGRKPDVPYWRQRDVGNLPDVVLDAMQRVAFRNDNQVARLTVERVDSPC